MSERKPLSISVDMSTDKMQLKLRAIAKHAEALANELEAIDNVVICPECGSDDVCTLRLGEEQRLADATCNNCNYDLPTRFEGSE